MTCRARIISVRNPCAEREFQCDIPFSDVPLEDVPFRAIAPFGKPRLYRTKNQPEVFPHKVFLRPPRVVDVHAFGSRTSAQRTLFSCAPSDGVGIRPDIHPDVRGISRPKKLTKLSLWAAFPFLRFTASWFVQKEHHNLGVL